MLELSIVIPVRNEQESIPILVKRLADVCDTRGWPAEFIFVTDLNTDATVDVLRSAHQADARVKMLKFSNGFGQHVAVMAGLRASSGNAVVVMDGDLQDHPEDIPLLYDKSLECYDIVYATKDSKNESTARNLLSAMFVKLINTLSDQPVVHNTSMFRIMSRRTVDALCRFPEHDPVITGLVSLVGLPTATVKVTSGVREAGETKYTLAQQMNLAISFLLGHSTKPLRMISVLGLIVSAVSFAYFLIVLLQAMMGVIDVVGWPTLVSLISLLGGMQLLALGILGEYVARIFIETKGRPLYIIEEQLGDFS